MTTSEVYDSVLTENAAQMSDRNLVRGLDGSLYAVITNFIRVLVFKSSDDGKSFVWQDSANTPYSSGGNFGGSCACAIDSLGVIHIAHDLWDTSASIRYDTFDTTTDLFVIKEEVITSAGRSGANISICIDSSDFPHVSYDLYDPTGTKAIRYKNRISGSWSTAIELLTGQSNYSCMGVDKDDLPWVVFYKFVDAYPAPSYSMIYACIGDANNPTSFTHKTLIPAAYWDSSTYIMPSTAIDVDGNHYVAYVSQLSDSATPYLAFKKHNYGDPWDTWDSHVVGAAGAYVDSFGQLTLMIDGTDLHFVYALGHDFGLGRVSHVLRYATYISGVWTDSKYIETSSNRSIFMVCCKWGYWVDNDKSGNNVGITGSRPRIECLFQTDDWQTDEYNIIYEVFYTNGLKMKVVMVMES